jgi:hypothetical protein
MKGLSSARYQNAWPSMGPEGKGITSENGLKIGLGTQGEISRLLPDNV